MPLKTTILELEGQPFLVLITKVYQIGKNYIGHEALYINADSGKIVQVV